jgi:hypothetical protein
MVLLLDLPAQSGMAEGYHRGPVLASRLRATAASTGA